MEKRFLIFTAIIICSLILMSCPEETLSPPQDGPIIEQVITNPLKFGETFKIKGMKFDSIRTNSDVFINDRIVDSVMFKYWSDTLIEMYLPPWASTGELYVKKRGMVSNKVAIEIFEYPFLTKIEPSFCFEGDTVYLIGRYFSNYTPDSSFLKIGINDVIPLNWSDTLITYITPRNNLGIDIDNTIKVKVGSKISNHGQLKVLNYPKINSVSPQVVTPNSTITINGSALKLYSLYFPDENPELYLNDTKITDISYFEKDKIVFKLPSNAVSGNLKTKRFGRESNMVYLKVVGQPTISSIYPEIATQSTLITINGSNFTNNQGKVWFNDKMAEIESWTDNTILCRVPDIKECLYLFMEVEGIKSNEVLFKVPDCKIISDFNLKQVDCKSYFGDFTDSLKFENGKFNFKFKPNTNGYYDFNSVSIEFDTQTLFIKNVSISFSFIEAGGGGRYNYFKQTMYNITATDIPVKSHTDNSLDYIIGPELGDKIKESFVVTGTWTDTKTGEHGTYDDKGTIDPSQMIPFEFHFY